MKVPAVKRYRTEIKKKKPKMSFDKAFGRFTVIAAGAAVGTAIGLGVNALFGDKKEKKNAKSRKEKVQLY